MVGLFTGFTLLVMLFRFNFNPSDSIANMSPDNHIIMNILLGIGAFILLALGENTLTKHKDN